MPTAALLDVSEAHAAARDAVWSALDPATLGLDAPVVRSRARDRREYLLRPDLAGNCARHGAGAHRRRGAGGGGRAPAPPACSRRLPR
jgi:ethanolamine ammonia-lyase small subunit